VVRPRRDGLDIAMQRGVLQHAAPRRSTQRCWSCRMACVTWDGTMRQRASAWS
jgi:hypothetical protein